MTMPRKTLALAVLLLVAIWGLQRASSNGYLSAFDASPKNLKLSVHSENNTVTVQWELKGGRVVRALAGGRDAIVLVYPDWVEKEDSWVVLGDPVNLSVSLNGRKAENLGIVVKPLGVMASNGSARANLRVFAIPVDFPSMVRSGKITLELKTYYGACNDFTMAVIYFHLTNRGEYRDLVLPFSVGFGDRFPVLPGFRSRFNLTIEASKMPEFLRFAVNAHYLGELIEEPRGWLVVKTVNVTVCSPKTS
ncbi:hypothetical protein [Thermococcus sp.]